VRRAACAIALVIAACQPAGDDDDVNTLEGDRAGLLCGNVTLDLLHEGLASSNPAQTNQRLADAVYDCWNLTMDVDPDHATSVGDYTRIDQDGPGGLLLGCGFHGSGNPVRLDLGDGGCVTPTATGYLRLGLRSPAQVVVASDIHSIQIETTWQEVRGDDLIVGTGRIFMSVPPGAASPNRSYDPRTPIDPIAGCHMPACSKAAFAGHGTRLVGNPAVCDELLAGYATPLEVGFDAQDRMSLAADTPEAKRLRPVYGETACTVDTWDGARPYPYRRFHFDPATGVMTIDETQLHQANNLADVCTIHWETTVGPCS
jgi:hypothetical protein